MSDAVSASSSVRQRRSLPLGIVDFLESFEQRQERMRGRPRAFLVTPDRDGLARR